MRKGAIGGYSMGRELTDGESKAALDAIKALHHFVYRGAFVLTKVSVVSLPAAVQRDCQPTATGWHSILRPGPGEEPQGPSGLTVGGGLQVEPPGEVDRLTMFRAWAGHVSEGRGPRCLMGEMNQYRMGTMREVGDVSDADVYGRHARDLIRFATVLVGPDDAQDVVSNAFVRCLSSNGWQEVSDRRAYLFRVVANEARNLKRSAARRRVRDAVVGGDPVVEISSPRPEVLSAIEALSVRQRSVVYLAYWEDMTDGMIADHLGIGSGSVRRHLGRARSKLREVLDE